MKAFIKMSIGVIAIILIFFNVSINLQGTKVINLGVKTAEAAPTCGYLVGYSICFCDQGGYYCSGWASCPSLGIRCSWNE